MTYTSEEVRALIGQRVKERNAVACHYGDAFVPNKAYDKQTDMLTAYADLLAQIERAEPYCYTWAKEPDADGVFRKIPLYTHPGADRLAEALRAVLDDSLLEGISTPSLATAEEILKAHVANVQEPSVPDRA